MAHPHRPILDWIDAQPQRMADMVRRWANINSYSHNLQGLSCMADELASSFATLDGDVSRLALPAHRVVNDQGMEHDAPVGDALVIRSRAHGSSATRDAAQPRVLLGIHMDTVYPPEQHREVALLPDGRMIGPGVADAKGGLAIMLVALEAIQRSEIARDLQWQVLINPDEEIGSPCSAALLTEAASQHDIGLVFEPSLDDAGTLAASRKGSGNFTIVVRGLAAHAGRRFAEGRNAVVAAANVAVQLAALNGQRDGLTVNVGRIVGGDAVNVVPDLAVCRLNIRVLNTADHAWALQQLHAIIARAGEQDGIDVQLHGRFHCPPKVLDSATRQLLDQVIACGSELGLNLHAQPTGGVCDGNKLAAAGLPTIDTLGVRGGSIHCPDEYLLVDSLTERAKLTALLLLAMAEGKLRSIGRIAPVPQD